MGVHESQSRLFENQIGRSREYMELIFSKLRGLFLEQFADVGPHGVWLAVNKSQP
jgi:carboxypeptidase Taq